MKKLLRSGALLMVSLMLLLLSQPFVFAAKPETVIPVEIRAKAYDPVGQALADQMTEAFKKDKQYSVATLDEPRLVVHLSTMGSEGKDGQRISAYAVILAFDLPGDNYQTLIGNTVGICNMKEVPDDAKAIVYNTTKLLEGYAPLTDAVKKSK